MESSAMESIATLLYSPGGSIHYGITTAPTYRHYLPCHDLLFFPAPRKSRATRVSAGQAGACPPAEPPAAARVHIPAGGGGWAQDGWVGMVGWQELWLGGWARVVG